METGLDLPPPPPRPRHHQIAPLLLGLDDAGQEETVEDEEQQAGQQVDQKHATPQIYTTLTNITILESSVLRFKI